MRLLKLIVVLFVFYLPIKTKAQEEKLPSFFNSNEETVEVFVPTQENSIQFRDFQKNSTVTLKQIGDENKANIQNRSALGEHKVFQLGDRNNYEFLNYNNVNSVNLGVLQYGNDNSLKMVGTNSMSNGLSIIQFKGAKLEMLNY